MKRILEKKPILIFGAMDCELNLLKASLTDARSHAVGDFEFTEGICFGNVVVLVRSLIGLPYAAAATAIALTKYDPAMLLVQGTAGAHNPALKTGDIILAEKAIHTGRYNTPHRDAGTGLEPRQWIFPEKEIFEENGFLYTYTADSDPDLVELAKKVPCDTGRVLTGTLATSDEWNRELDRIAFFRKKFHTDCEDMESYAVLKISASLQVPALSIRVISNGEFMENQEEDYRIYGEAVQKFVLRFLQMLQP